MICEALELTNDEQIPMTEEEKLALEMVKQSFLQSSPDKLGRTNVYEHVIETGDAVPFQKRYYPVSPYVQAEINLELERMLKLDVVEPASSPWANPIVTVPKSTGKLRLCLDARKLNSVTVKESYPLPYITRILGRLSGTKYLTSIDLSDAFWQVPLHKSSRPKTAFVVPGRGLFQFKVMPFGLCNAAQSMCRLMDKVLGYDLEPFVFVYLDDIIIATNDMEQHLKMLKTVADRLAKANLTINVEKSKFCVKSLKYLGFVLDSAGLHTDPEKIRAIVGFPTPTCVKDVRRLLGMASWYRRFIENFATETAPLTELLKKGVKRFKWTEEAQKSFEILKNKLTSAPVLANPNYNEKFIIQCDASDVGVGAVLLQGEGDCEKVVAYMSQKLSCTQQKYSTTEKECLAIILAIEKFRAYVEGVEFLVVTDHSSLQWLQSMTNPTGRLWRWTMRIQPYNFKIIHRKGSLNVVPDALSRAVVESCELIRSPNRDDSDWYGKLWKRVSCGEGKVADYKISEDKLYKHCASKRKYGLNEPKWKMVVAPECKDQIFREMHDSPLSGHFGFHKTLDRISEQFYWPGMSRDTRDYVRLCEICKASKSLNHKPNPPMGEPKISNGPWDLISMDFLGPYPRTKAGNTVILVITDWFSKFVVAKPLRNADAKSMVKFLEDHVFLTFGVPTTVWSDNGRQFVSKNMSDLLKRYQVNHVFTPLYAP